MSLLTTTKHSTHNTSPMQSPTMEATWASIQQPVSSSTSASTPRTAPNAQYYDPFSSHSHSDDIDTDKDFASAVEYISNARVPMSNDSKLSFYAWFKIATSKSATPPFMPEHSRPGLLDFVSRAKWDAWVDKAESGMDKTQAKREYIKRAESLGFRQGGLLPDQSRLSATTMPSFSQPAVSTMRHITDSPPLEKTIFDHAREGTDDEGMARKLAMGLFNVHSRDTAGLTPLHWASDRGHISTVRLLVSNNADVNAQDNDGQSPLHHATLSAHHDIASLLVRNGANPTLAGQRGCNPRE